MHKNSEKPLTRKDLGEFTEETLLPAVGRIIGVNIEEKVPPMLNKVKLDLMDYVDEKIADLRGDIIVLLRKEDRRFLHLVEVLYRKDILTGDDIKVIEELQLFPGRKK